MPRQMPTTLRLRFRAQTRGGSLLHHVPNRPPRFPTSAPPPGPSAHPSGFSIRSQRDSIGFNPTAFKTPVRTPVATEFNSREQLYCLIFAPVAQGSAPTFFRFGKSSRGGFAATSRPSVVRSAPSDRGTSAASSNLVRQLAKLRADALGLFLVSMHDGILKHGVKSLDCLNRTCPP